MKQLLILTCLMLGLHLSADAQQNLKNHLLESISADAHGHSDEVHSPFTLINDNRRGLSDLKVTDLAILLTTDHKLHQDLKSAESDLQMELPINKTETVMLNLSRVSVMAEDFQVVLASDDENAISIDPGLHYWGKVVGDPNSLVTINVYEDEMSGVISFDDQVLTLTKLNDQDEIHTIYDESDLDHEESIGCMTDDVEHFMGNLKEDHNHGRSAGNANNCVRVYLEVANDVYKDKGGKQGTTNYITGLFNQVIALYAAESINMSISKLKLWNTNDPYTGGASNQMNKLKTRLNGIFDGDIAHLVSYGNGGVAYVDVLRCNYKKFAVGFSGIAKTYKNVPSYSWSVNVLTHEIGHNLGSSHTHACVWNGNNTQIDDCGSVYGAVEGSCYKANNKKLPSSGTIMSYCHLLRDVGIKFSNGFGTQPGNLIRDRVHNSDCLGTCGSGPATPTEELVVTISKKNLSCGESADGSATANPTGGSGSYTYSWNNGKKTRTISALKSGTYRVTVSDGNKTRTKSVTIAKATAAQCACDVTTVAPWRRMASPRGSRVASRITLPAGTRDVRFIVRRIEQTASYNEQVSIHYVDGNNVGHLYGIFRGSKVSGVRVFIPGEVKKVIIALKNVGPAMKTGTIRVVYTNLKGCVPGASTANIIAPKTETRLDESLNVQIYPNPASDQFQIEMSQVAESGKLYMFDGLGTMVHSEAFEQRNRLPVNASQFPRGTYFVRIETQSFEPITKRIVIN